MHSLFPGSTNNHFCCVCYLPFCLSSGWWSNKQFSVHTQLFSHKTVLHISELLLLVPRSCKGASTPGLTNARPTHHWDRYTLDTCFFSWIMILEIRLPYPGEDKKGTERCPLISRPSKSPSAELSSRAAVETRNSRKVDGFLHHFLFD